MNNAPKIEAYNSFYDQGKKMFASGDIQGARDAFLKAAEIADQISVESKSYDVKMDYHKQTARILDFVKKNCSQKVVPNNAPKMVSQSVEEFDFKPEPKTNQISFKDVAGLEDVKEQIVYKVIEPQKNPEIAKKYKINAGGKILLYGPPGTGKTFIARAIAGEVDAEFYVVNCQDLISKFMGDSSKQLDRLFEQALKNEKAIIFFDEFDSVASKRGDGTSGVDAEMARFVATFLTKVDGFKKSKDNKMMLLISATNRPWALDSAMLRGGRFDVQIYVGTPDLKARKFMVKKAFDGIPLDADVDLSALAQRLDGYGGGDIVAVCQKIVMRAYMRAVKNGKEENVSNFDIEEVVSNLRNVITDEELEKFEAFKNGEQIGD